MPQEIKQIRLQLPYKLGTVNCYLIQTDTGYVLIDTGSSNQRTALDTELAGAGCQPGQLKLILLTHGDFDHTGNAAYLREKYGAPIAMHSADSGMIERGDMFWNRKKGNAVLRSLSPILFGFSRAERCKPDLALEEGYDLSRHGLPAQVLSIPGHSQGSIGILMPGGDLFCGDLFENIKRPVLNSIMDDPVAARASAEKLKRLKIELVYPGHGQPFSMEQVHIE